MITFETLIIVSYVYRYSMNMYVKFILYAYIHFKFNYESMKQYL